MEIIMLTLRFEKLRLIVCTDENWAIGKNGKIPWHLSKDLRRFKDLTINNNVIMGRKTFESIGQPLKNRKNIIVTKDKSLEQKLLDNDVIIASSVVDALEICNGDAFVIGGASIYQYCLPLVSEIYLTKVHTQVENPDVFFDLSEGLEEFVCIDYEYVSADENNNFDSTYAKLVIKENYYGVNDVNEASIGQDIK